MLKKLPLEMEVKTQKVTMETFFYISASLVFTCFCIMIGLIEHNKS